MLKKLKKPNSFSYLFYYFIILQWETTFYQWETTFYQWADNIQKLIMFFYMVFLLYLYYEKNKWNYSCAYS